MSRKVIGALIFAASFAIAGHVATARHHVCRIKVTDSQGNVWIAGAGDSLADAWKDAQFPGEWRSLEFPGCYFTEGN